MAAHGWAALLIALLLQLGLLFSPASGAAPCDRCSRRCPACQQCTEKEKCHKSAATGNCWCAPNEAPEIPEKEQSFAERAGGGGRRLAEEDDEDYADDEQEGGLLQVHAEGQEHEHADEGGAGAELFA